MILPEIGTLFENRFKLIKSLGSGGFAAAYLAEDIQTNEKVVLKFPDPTLLGDPAVYERFHREINIGQRLQNSDLPAVVAFSTERPPYLTVKYIEGESLAKVLKEKGKFPADQVVYMVSNLLEALYYCHRQGVFHRDLKPENLILGSDGRLKIIDFGIALIEGSPRVTWRGFSELMGTPEYMAPEQIKGERGNEKSDIYAIGCLLYHLLTGQPPFIGDNPLAVMYQHMTADPQDLSAIIPELHPGIRAAISRALRRRKEERYDSALEMADDLRNPQNIDLHWIKKPNPPLSYIPPTKQNYFILTSVSIIFGVILALLFILIRFHK